VPFLLMMKPDNEIEDMIPCRRPAGESTRRRITLSRLQT
jgi:hypothetical protein